MHLLALFVVLVVGWRCCCRCLSCSAFFFVCWRCLSCFARPCVVGVACFCLELSAFFFCVSSTRLSSLFSLTRFPFFACPVGGWVTESAWTFMSRAGRYSLRKGERGPGRGVSVARWVSGGVFRFFFPIFLLFFGRLF